MKQHVSLPRGSHRRVAGSGKICSSSRTSVSLSVRLSVCQNPVLARGRQPGSETARLSLPRRSHRRVFGSFKYISSGCFVNILKMFYQKLLVTKLTKSIGKKNH